MLNVRLLRRVKEKILKHPSHFNMSHWLVQKDPEWDRIMIDEAVNPEDLKNNTCGTVGCIAGWTVAQCGFKKTDFVNTNIRRLASEKLGLTTWAAVVLFLTDHWPDKLQERYDSVTTARSKARIAAEAIEWFIEFRKGVEKKLKAGIALDVYGNEIPSISGSN